eukprot:scaffold20382_cov67-Attheya_sp.AAC.4
MAPTQTALSTTMMSPLTTDDTTTTSQPKRRCPYADSAFGSKYQCIISNLYHEAITANHPLGAENFRSSIDHASMSAGAHNTAIYASESAFATNASPDLPPGATVSGDSTVANTGSTIATPLQMLLPMELPLLQFMYPNARSSAIRHLLTCPAPTPP